MKIDKSNVMANGVKTGGRSVGTPNKITKDMREKINDFVNDNWDQVQKDYMLIEPEKRIMLFDKFLQYTLPKMKTVEYIDNDKNTIAPKKIVFVDFNNEDNIHVDLSKLSTDELIKRAEAIRTIEEND